MWRELAESSRVIWSSCKSDPCRETRERRKSLGGKSLKIQCNSRKFHQNQWEVLKSKLPSEETHMSQEWAHLSISAELSLPFGSTCNSGLVMKTVMAFRAQWPGSSVNLTPHSQRSVRPIPMAATHRDPESLHLEDLSFYLVLKSSALNQWTGRVKSDTHIPLLTLVRINHMDKLHWTESLGNEFLVKGAAEQQDVYNMEKETQAFGG